MGNRHMTSRQAVILAGALAAVILILLIPVWRGVAWSDEVVEDDSQQPATKVAVEATPEDNEDTASGGAVRAVVRVSSGSSIDEFIDTTGKTLADRVALPEGYEQDAQEEELAQYLRDYSVYKKTKIKYYTGRTKSVSGEAVAVLKLPMEEVNLQQQTASVQRMYGEYFWSKGEYDRIKFTVSGTQVQFAKEGQEAGTYEDFVKFLQQKVYPASGYRSLLKDCKSVDTEWFGSHGSRCVCQCQGQKSVFTCPGRQPGAAVPCDIKSAASGRSMVLSERNPNFYEDADSGF